MSKPGESPRVPRLALPACEIAQRNCVGTAADNSSKILVPRAAPCPAAFRLVGTDVVNSLEQGGDGFWRRVASLLGIGRDNAPIDSVAALAVFVSSRSTYVAQKTLYGYVKTRMGLRYVVMFEDDKIVASLNVAKLHVFADCLSDLTVYAVAETMRGAAVGNDTRAALARRCYRQGLDDNVGEAPVEFSAPEAIAAFDARLAETDWPRAGRPDIFTRSPAALARWAPIADQLKRLDTEVIENSVKFSWPDIRAQLQKRLDAAAVAEDWMRHSGG
jgi:hypothetical protein